MNDRAQVQVSDVVMVFDGDPARVPLIVQRTLRKMEMWSKPADQQAVAIYESLAGSKPAGGLLVGGLSINPESSRIPLLKLISDTPFIPWTIDLYDVREPPVDDRGIWRGVVAASWPLAEFLALKPDELNFHDLLRIAPDRYYWPEECWLVEA